MIKSFNNILKETETASGSGISQAAPEKVIEVINGDNQMSLKETTENRLQLRKLLNEQLFESVDNHTLSSDMNSLMPLTESVFDAAKSWILFEKQEEENKKRNSPRYKLQNWTNGGGGDGTEKGQPSAYEIWRKAIVDKRRTKRLEQELADATNPFKSSTTTDVSRPTLDNQEDDFLSWWINKTGVK